ncbi:CHASE2 domain-containing protein [Candidatus Desantisbacteria bacterium]|nr:CHASE2 domain-containing protein [Candidatus Desantisbacteria bacterium]
MKINIYNIKKSIFILVLTYIILLILLLFFSSSLEVINYKFFDLKMKICGNLRSDKNKIREKIVTISVEDNKTIPEIGFPSILYHAKMIEKLTKIGVHSILYDFVFNGNISEEFIDKSKNANIFWPIIFNLTREKKNAFKLNKYSTTQQKLIINYSIYNSSTIAKTDNFYYSTQGMFPNNEIIYNSKGTGHSSTQNDENDTSNTFRKMALLLNIDEHLFPSIDLVVICNYLQVPVDKIVIKPGQEIIIPNAKFPDSNIEDVIIPINERYEMWINYIKPWNINKHGFLEPFWFVSILNLENDPEQEKEIQDRLKNKICLVGNASTINRDIHIIPIDDNYPGIGIHSHVIYTILSKNFIKFLPVYYTLIIIFINLLALSLIIDKLNSILVFSLSLVFNFFYFFVSYILFIISGIAFYDFIPFLGFLLYGLLYLIVSYLYKTKEVTELKQQLELLNNELDKKKCSIGKYAEELLEFRSKKVNNILISETVNETINKLKLKINEEEERIKIIEKEKEELLKRIS